VGWNGEAGLVASNLDGYRDAAGGLHGVLRTNIMKLSNCILTLAAQEAQIAHAFVGVRENVGRTLGWGFIDEVKPQLRGDGLTGQELARLCWGARIPSGKLTQS
jgi:hypothetical protein